MRKKLLTLFLAVAASVGTMFAQSGTCGDNLTWDLTDGVLTISGTGAMKDYNYYNSSPWLHSSITSVTIGNSVTSIGNYAFCECSSLTSVTIPNSVTSIGERAFYGCSSLTSVTIPNSVTSIGDYAFFCRVPNIIYNGTATGSPWGARSINGFVDGYLVYKDNTKTTLLACFSAAQGEISIPNSVTSIGSSAFSGCSSLTSVTIPNSVTSIGSSAFSGCSSLTSVTIPNSVTSIGDGAFHGCSSLTSVTIPNSVTSIGYDAFRYCISLTSVTIPNSVTSIGNYAFSGCSSLTSPVYNAHVFAFMPTSYSGAFTIPDGIESIAGGAFRGCRSLTSVTIPNSVTSIGNWAFSYCYSLTSVTIPNSVTSIGEYAFYQCSNLKDVVLGSSLEVLEKDAFSGCRSIETITCYSMRPPTVKDEALDGLPYTTIVYVPADAYNIYNMHDIWGLYDVRPMGAVSTQTEEIKITPTETTVDVVWPVVADAATYELVIKDKNGNIICTLVFNSKGQLTSIAFNAPARDGVPEHTQAEGFSFTVTGLNIGSTYNYTLTTKDSNGNTLDTKTGTFRTKGGTVTTYTLALISADATMGTVTGSGEYEEGEEVTITATPAKGFRFVEWNDGNTDNPRTVVIDKDMTLTARFEEIPNALDDTQAEKSAPRKVIENGVLYIVMPDGSRYSASGAGVK